MPTLKLVTLASVLAHAGLVAPSGLGRDRGAPHTKPFWELATPTTNEGMSLEASRLFRSITEHVNDDEKRAAFALMVNGISRASALQNYQEVLKGSNIVVKVAHDFKYLGRAHKLWELKANKKDRIYFFALKLKILGRERNVIVLLMAFHKKDQHTPKEVCSPCEEAMKQFLDPKASIQIKDET